MPGAVAGRSGWCRSRILTASPKLLTSSGRSTAIAYGTDPYSCFRNSGPTRFAINQKNITNPRRNCNCFADVDAFSGPLNSPRIPNSSLVSPFQYKSSISTDTSILICPNLHAAKYFPRRFSRNSQKALPSLVGNFLAPQRCKKYSL